MQEGFCPRPARHFVFLFSLSDSFRFLVRFCLLEGKVDPVTSSAELASSHFPFLDPSRLAGEADPDFENPASIGGKGLGIAFVLDLFQGLVRAGIHLQFHDIDVLAGLHHDVIAVCDNGQTAALHSLGGILTYKSTLRFACGRAPCILPILTHRLDWT